MLIDRRTLLKLLGTAAGAAGLGPCKRLWLLPEDRVAMALRGPGIESQKHTVCGLCEGSCGITVRLVDGLPVGLKGNPRHPLNRGGLCPVGQAGLELLYSPSRLQSPLRRSSDGTMEATTWDEALGQISGHLTRLRDAGHGDRIALLTGEPSQLFTELGERFLAALGSPNVARWNEPTLHFELTQGIDQWPGFDYPGTDLFVAFGLDVFEDGPAPIHAISSLVGQRETEFRARLIQVGTRLSPSASRADERLTVRPGTHGALALGLAHVLVREGTYDRAFVAEHTVGFEDRTNEDGRRLAGFRRLLLERYYPDRVADICGCDARDILRVAQRIGEAKAPLAVAGGEALQASNATWTGMAVHSLNALLGSFDRLGGVRPVPPLPVAPLEPLSVPQGGNRVFAATGEADPHRRDPIAALLDAATENEPAVEVLFVVGGNPVYDSPLGGALREALERIPLVVTITGFPDETAMGSDLVLPTPSYLEAWHDVTVPSGVPVGSLSISDPVLEPLFDTLSAADILLTLAQRLGEPTASALPWQDYQSYLQERIEGLLTSGQGSVISGSFEESWVHYLEERGWRFLDHGDFESFWQDLLQEGGWWNPVVATGAWERLFPHPSGRFEFLPSALGAETPEVGADDPERFFPHHEAARIEGEGELVLLPFRPITSRGGQAALSPMILEMFGYPLLSEWETWAEIAPETAEELGIHDGDTVALETERGSIEVVARLRPGTAPGTVHTPLGLGRREGLGPFGRVGSHPLTILPDVRDSLSGAPSLVSTKVRVRMVRRREHGGPSTLLGVH